MAVDPQHPVQVLRDLRNDRLQRGHDRIELLLRVGAERRAARVEQDLGLKYEAVSDDPDILPVADDLAKPPEEFRAVTGQFLDLAGERDVQPLGQIAELY